MSISFSDFQKLDIRAAQIKEIEDISGSDKLYKLQIDLGSETRQLVAGIKKFYSKEELEDKKILVIANLEPRKVFGVLSSGMLLAASTDSKDNLTIATVDRDIPNGAKVS
jgi:methionine--tRNA ligase beta chain